MNPNTARADSTDKAFARRMARVREISKQILVTRAQERHRQQEELKPLLDALSELRTSLEHFGATSAPRASVSGFRIAGTSKTARLNMASDRVTAEEVEQRRQAVRSSLQALSARRQALAAAKGRRVSSASRRRSGAAPSATKELPEGLGAPTVQLDAIERLEKEVEVIVGSEDASPAAAADRASRLAALLKQMEVKRGASHRPRTSFRPTFQYRDRDEK